MPGQKRQRNRKRDQYLQYVELCCVVSCHNLSCYGEATLSVILCPNVAWSRVGLHLECVGPSIIPLCKYLLQETGLLPLAKTRESIRGTQRHIQLWTERGREGGIKPTETGGTERKKERRERKENKERVDAQSRDRWTGRLGGTEGGR